MGMLTLQQLPLQGKRVLVRVDFNVPLAKNGAISDDTRIREAIPTIQYILDRGGKVILMSHLGRPKSRLDIGSSLGICAKRLSQLISAPVLFAPDCVGKEVEKMVADLKNGQVLLLENLRFHKAEENPETDPNFAKQLASLGDYYINDAFGTAHRKHASTAIVPQFFPGKGALGLLMQKELSFLQPLAQSPKHPFYVVLGGSKISTKLNMLKALSRKADAFFIGGGMAFTLLKAQGVDVGNSLVEDTLIEQSRDFLKNCSENQIPVHLPTDLIIAQAIREDAPYQIISTKEGIPQGWEGVDIGPQTIQDWTPLFQPAATIFWNGPLGVFEISHFAKGTQGIAMAIATTKAITVVGGGDSIAAIYSLHLEKSFSHLSTGGGACLEFLEWGHLPGIDVLS